MQFVNVTTFEICIYIFQTWQRHSPGQYLEEVTGSCVLYLIEYENSGNGNKYRIELSWIPEHFGSFVNTLRPRQDGCQFPDDILKCIFLNENISILIEISLKFIPKGPINNVQALVQILAWCQLGDKPLSETMVVSLLTHICVTRPQWVKL